MKYIKLDRSQLIHELGRAKKKAMIEYARKLKTYKRERIAQLKAEIEALETGKKNECECRVYAPSSPENDYNRFIDLVNLAVDPTLVLREDLWRTVTNLLQPLHQGE